MKIRVFRCGGSQLSVCRLTKCKTINSKDGGVLSNFRVCDMLNLEVFKSSKILGKECGLENEITGVTVIETPDIDQFVSGGEVLITRMYAFQGCTLEEYRQNVCRLSQLNISAVVVKRGETLNQERLEVLLSLAGKNNIPVIHIPSEIPYSSIMYPVMERLFSAEITKLKYFKSTYDSFASISLMSTVKDGFGKILDVLEKLIGNHAMLFDKNLFCIAPEENEACQLKITIDLNNKQTLYSKYSYASQLISSRGGGQYKQYIVPVNVMFNRTMYLVINETEHPLECLDFIAVENAVSALIMEFSKQRTILEVEKKFGDDIVGSLLRGEIHSQRKLHHFSNLLGLPVDGQYRVVVASLEDTADKGPGYNKIAELNHILYNAILVHIDSEKIHDQVSNIAVLQILPGQQNPEEYKAEMNEILTMIQQKISQKHPTYQLSVGIGNIASGFEEIPRSYDEAANALKFSAFAGKSAERQLHQMVLYSELGVLRMLLKLKETENLVQFIPQSLVMLCDHKKHQHYDLIETLQAFLDNKQNISKTARALFVHYKTVRYRIERIIEITGIDFDNANDVLSAQIGLMIARITELNESSRL